MGKVLLLVFAIILSVFGAPSSDYQPNQRIVKGSVAPEGAFPYQVRLMQFQSFLCNGAIIDSTTILTAAQCVQGLLPVPILVVAGTNKISSGGTVHVVKSVRVHENYDPMRLTNAVAILKIEPPIELSDKAQPIEMDFSYVGVGVSSVYASWGLTSYPEGSFSDDLLYINTTTLSAEECQSHYEGIVEISETEICTLPKGEGGGCYGDEGSALVANGKQIAIGSWGIPCAVGYPEVYVRLSFFADWIEEHRK